jgi:acyl-CoA reductase-like NAD-dependent aldehyde dehydrogenase
VVTGLPSEIGDALTTHPDVGKIGFTGSIPSARHIMANAAQTIKGVTLELGGNDAAIVLDDADFSAATMKSMLGATFMMTGQVCMAIKRIYVPTKRCDEFLGAFAKSAETLVVGDGLEPAVTMGPLHTRKAQERADGLVEDAVRRGADVRQLGRIDNELTFSGGYFMRPVVVTNIPEDAPLMTEEQFCPAVPIATYDDVDDAITRANHSIYGLSGSVWSRDVDRAIKVAGQMEAGQVWINSHGVYAINHLAPAAASSKAELDANPASKASGNIYRARPSRPMKASHISLAAEEKSSTDGNVGPAAGLAETDTRRRRHEAVSLVRFENFN